MSKKILLACILLTMFMLIGCNQDTGIEDINDIKIKTVNDVKIRDLQAYQGTWVGNTSAVGAIIRLLPGGATYQEFELANQTVKVIYGLKEGSELTDEEFAKYWLNEDTMQKSFLYNAVAIFVHVKNAERVILEVNDMKHYSFSISRADLEKELSHGLDEYASDVRLWEEDILHNLVLSEQKRQDFFSKYEIKED